MDHKETRTPFKVQMDLLDKAPNDAVWNKINTALDTKKKKRRIIPFWFRFGLAGLFVVGVTLLYNYYNMATISNTVINKETLNNVMIFKETSNTKINTPKANNKKTDTSNKAIVRKNENISKHHTKQINKKKFLLKNPKMTTPKNNHLKSNNSNNNIEKTPSDFTKQAIAFSNERITLITKNAIEKNTSIINKTQKHSSKVGIKNASKDTILIKKVSKKKIKSKLNKKILKKEQKNEMKNKWQASIVGGLLNFKTSTTILSKDFPNKTIIQNGKVSYGLGLNYQLSNKIKLASGLQLINLTLKTDEIQEEIIINSEAFLEADFSNLNPNSSGLQAAEQYVVSQKMSYLEIPFNFKYNLLNKKIKTNLVVGASSLILLKNRAFLNDIVIGKINNLNRFSFTTNLGVDFSYELNKKLSLRFNPMYKTQWNMSKITKDNLSIFGFYSGIAYQF